MLYFLYDLQKQKTPSVYIYYALYFFPVYLFNTAAAEILSSFVLSKEIAFRSETGYKNTNKEDRSSKRKKIDEFLSSMTYWLRLLVLLNIFGYEGLLLSLKVKKRDFVGCIVYQKSEKACHIIAERFISKLVNFWTASSSSFISKEDERNGIHHHKTVDSWNLSIMTSFIPFARIAL